MLGPTSVVCPTVSLTHFEGSRGFGGSLAASIREMITANSLHNAHHVGLCHRDKIATRGVGDGGEARIPRLGGGGVRVRESMLRCREQSDADGICLPTSTRKNFSAAAVRQ